MLLIAVAVAVAPAHSALHLTPMAGLRKLMPDANVPQHRALVGECVDGTTELWPR